MSTSVFCQTLAKSFDYQFHGSSQAFTKNQIDSFICKSNFENFRLQDQRVTLTFDNGFDLILLSANELQQSGVISNASTYQTAFPPNYHLPKFHINQSGQVAAEYQANPNVKFSRKKN